MTDHTFEWGRQSFTFKKELNQWTLVLKRSDIATQDLKQLRVLDLHHPSFLKQQMEVTEDAVCFQYDISPDGITAEEMEQWSYSEKLRVALNAISLSDCLHLPVTFFLHPENLFITKDGCLQIAYRGVPALMTPFSLDAEEFLRQVKCYIIHLFLGGSYMDLYNGGLEVSQLPDFLDRVRQSENVSDLEALMVQTYRSKKEEERATTVRVSKERFKWFKLGTIWFGVVSLLLIIPLIYLVFVQHPFMETLLAADAAFIKVDYAGVIQKLDKIESNQLPYTQKYELAYAYIQGLDFSAEQKRVILNNVTLKSDELYLDYWVAIGRGQVDDAIDVAKRLDEADLILYALLEKREQVRENKQLTGSDREGQLSEIDAEYQKYWDKRSSLLEKGNGADDTTTESSTITNEEKE